MNNEQAFEKLVVAKNLIRHLHNVIRNYKSENEHLKTALAEKQSQLNELKSQIGNFMQMSNKDKIAIHQTDISKSYQSKIAALKKENKELRDIRDQLIVKLNK